MEQIIYSQTVLSADGAIDSSTPTEVLVTAERNCCIVWVRSAEYPTGYPLGIQRSEAGAKAVAKRIASETSHVGLMNLATALRNLDNTLRTPFEESAR